MLSGFRERKEKKMTKNSERPTNLHHSHSPMVAKDLPMVRVVYKKLHNNYHLYTLPGTRVVLGRETSPAPAQQGSRLPGEIMEKFGSKSREVRTMCRTITPFDLLCVAGPDRDGGDAEGPGGGPGEEGW